MKKFFVQHLNLAVFIAGLWLLVLIIFALISINSRMMADDYCTAAVGMANDALTATLYYYNNWTGAYSDSFFKSILAYFQPTFHIWQLLFFMCIWFGAMWLLWADVMQLLNLHHPKLLAVILTLFFMFVTTSTISAVGGQNLYWFATLSPYTMPIILVTIISDFIIRLLTARRSVFVEVIGAISVFILVALTAGFAEIYATLQVTALALTLLFAWLYIPLGVDKKRDIQWLYLLTDYRKKLLAIVGVALIVALIALLVMALAPGNFVRLEQQEQTAVEVSLFQLAINVLNFTLLMFVGEGNSTAHFLFTFFAVILGLFWWYLPSQQHELVALPYPKHPLRIAILVGIAAFLLVGAVITPPLYATNHVAARIVFPARFVQICLFVVWGYLAAVGLAKYRFRERFERRFSYRVMVWILIGLMFFMPLNTLVRQIDLLRDAPRYAAEWDVRHELILAAKAQGHARIDVPPLSVYFEDYLGLEKIEPEAKSNWVNSCASSYYGLQVFVAEEE